MRRGLVVRVELPSGLRIWLVPTGIEAGYLIRRSAKPGEVWTVRQVRELRDAGLTSKDAQAVAECCVLFNGYVGRIRSGTPNAAITQEETVA